MKLRDDVNEYGTKVTVFICEYCGREFTVVPAIPDARLHAWKGCLAPDCESYDEERDLDEMVVEGCIVALIEHRKEDDSVLN